MPRSWLVFRQKLSEKMRICLLTSFLQVLMILSKNLISNPSWKKTNITPVFKRGDRNSKYNYKPVRILPNMFKIFERCIFRQSYSFMFEFLSNTTVIFSKVTIHSIACKPCLKRGNLQLIKEGHSVH